MTTFTFRRVHSTILILLGGFLLSSALAEAEMVDVTITADAAPLGPGTVFGQSESSPATVRFRLDTSNPIIIPAGTQIGPFESDIIATDLYGYNGISAISASYGTKTWDGADVASSSLDVHRPDLSAAVWFNGPVTVGGNAIPNIDFRDNDGFLVTAPMACGLIDVNYGCMLMNYVNILESAGGMAIGDPLTIAVVSVTDPGVGNRKCKPVVGNFEAVLVLPGQEHCPPGQKVFCTAGRVWGGIQGNYQFAMTGEIPSDSIGGVSTIRFFAGKSTIFLKKDGNELYGTDTGSIDLPPGQGGFASLITFAGGTGDMSGATGQIRLRGEFDAGKGATTGDYIGTLCKP